MRHGLMVLVFLFGFVLKANLVLAADQESISDADTPSTTKVEAKEVAKAPEPTAAPAAKADNVTIDENVEAGDEDIITEKTEKTIKTIKKAKVKSTNNSGPSKIENHIRVEGASISYAAPQSTSNNSDVAAAATVLGTKASLTETPSRSSSLIPLVGVSAYNGGWYNHVYHKYSFGVALELPVSDSLALEVEGGTSRYSVSYSSVSHNVNQYLIGANAKAYLSRATIHPYLGLGFSGLYYENLQNDMTNPNSRYNRWVGAAQLIAGADVPVASTVALGLRAAWVVPVVNRPASPNNGIASVPGYQDASFASSSFYRILGSVKVSF